MLLVLITRLSYKSAKNFLKDEMPWIGLRKLVLMKSLASRTTFARPFASAQTGSTHPLFRISKIRTRPEIFQIEEKFFDSWNRANIFYIVGKTRDLLVDTGDTFTANCFFPVR